MSFLFAKFIVPYRSVRGVAMRGLRLNDEMNMAVSVRTNGIPKVRKDTPLAQIRVDEGGEYIYIDQKYYLKDMVQQEEEL